MPNPSTIMGANALSHFDVAEGGLFQNPNGTTAVADGDRVGFLPDAVAGQFVSTNNDHRPTFRANAGDPYLEGNVSNLRKDLSRSGTIYGVFRARFPNLDPQVSHMVILGSNATFWQSPNIAARKVDFGGRSLELEGTGVSVQYTRNIFHTFEFYFDGVNAALAIDGGAFVTAGQSIIDSLYIDLFTGRTGSGLDGAGGRTDIQRGAFVSAIPDSTERAALLDWAENGDTGGGDPVEIQVPASTIGVSPSAPTINAGASATIPAASIGLAPQPPSVSSGASIVSGIAEIGLAAHAPRVAAGKSVAVPTAAISIGANAPSVATGAIAFLAAASIAIAGFAPSISTGVRVGAPTATIAVAPLAPSIITGARVDVPPASITVQANLPSLGAGTTITIPAAAVQVLAAAPEVSTGVVVAVPGAGVVIAGLPPVVGSGGVIRVPAASVSLAALAPTIEAASLAFVDVPVAQIAVAGIAPQIFIGAPPVLSARRVATPGQSANGGRLKASANGGRLIQSRNGGRLV